MPTRQVRFGSVDLPLGFAPLDDSLARDIQPAKLPRTDGSRVIQGYAGEKVILVGGMLIKGPISNLGAYSDLRSAVDALKAQLAGGPANLYFFDDRYYRDVQARSVGESFVEKRFESIANIDIEFVTGDPFLYSASESDNFQSAPVNGSSWVISPGGNAFALPTFRIDVGATGTADWRLSNNTSGEYFDIDGAVTLGQVIEIDTRAKTVKVGSTDKMSLFDGQFPRLLYTANTFELTVTAVAIASIRTIWRNRWWG